MIPFKGRLGFKQYLKDKPTKWGIKFWGLAYSTNRYVKKLQVYTGKSVGIGLCFSALHLMKGLENTGLHLYNDNYLQVRPYSTTYTLVASMPVEQHVTIAGTSPKTWVTNVTSSNRGFSDHRVNGPLLSAVRVDKQPIYLVSILQPPK